MQSLKNDVSYGNCYIMLCYIMLYHQTNTWPEAHAHKLFPVLMC